MPLSARTRTLAGALAAGLLMTALILLPGHAGAQDAAKPTPCTGEMLIVDPPGDQEAADLVGLTTHAGPPNQDITGVFLNFKDGILTANIEIANLTKDLPPITDSQAGAWYYVVYTDGAVRRFVRAVNDTGGDISYAYGSISTEGPAAGVYTTEGDTKGAFVEGPKGVIQIEIPAAAGAKAGAALKGVLAVADNIQGFDDQVGFNSHVDVAPDTGDVVDLAGGAEYTATACPSTPAAGGGTTTTPPVGGGGTTPTTTVLPLKVNKVLDGAKKATKKKALRISVAASETITNLSISLKPKNGKGKTYASVKVATLSGTKTLKLKRKAKLKAGSYSLVAKGTVGGTTRKATFVVKVKK